MSIIPIFQNIGVVLAAAFFVLLPFELWMRHRQGELTVRSIQEMGASTSPFIVVVLVNGVVIAFITALISVFALLVPWQIPATWFTATLCLMFVDLLYYADHYCGHRFRVYWAISHSVHHSSPQFDQTTALRVSAVDGFTSPWFLIPALLAGFEPLLVLACFGIVIAYQQWIHTETVGSLGWFDKVFNSPSNHRVHHGSNPQYLDKNYGGVFILWDRLFGTHEVEAEQPVYGLVKPLESHNPIHVHFHEAILLFRDLKTSKSLREVLHHLFARPGQKFIDPSRSDKAQ